MTAPDRFTTQTLDWVPWLAPMAEEDLTDRHYEGLVQRPRARNPYFRLLADEPDVLGARTRADLEIFHNTADGLPRAERELAATVASRVNGCIYCASVHSAFAAHFSKRPDDIQRLLDEGVDADLGEGWNAVVAAAAALTATPPTFGAEHVRRLREAGYDEVAVLDLVNAAAFFGWANRLMLSLGEPEVPTD
jgi:alkylhydroperoxidase domain protein